MMTPQPGQGGIRGHERALHGGAPGGGVGGPRRPRRLRVLGRRLQGGARRRAGLAGTRHEVPPHHRRHAAHDLRSHRIARGRASAAAQAACQGPPARHGDGDAGARAARRRHARAHHRAPRRRLRADGAQPGRAPGHQVPQRRVADAARGAGGAAMKRTSVWVDTGPEHDERPQLDSDVDAEVCVIGGGIVGITTAALLQDAGVRTVLLEANRLACGVSGFTTAKVSSQHGLVYARLRSRFGRDGAATYGAANQAALEWMAARIEQDGIECDWRRRPSYAYLSDDRAKAEQEAEAAIEAGLPASLVEETGLPYEVAAAVRFDDQAEFHVRKYLLALSASLTEVYERSHAVDVDVDGRCAVKTPGGRVTADRVVVATHYPFLDRALAFPRVHPQRSYALVCSIDGEPPPGMYISGDSPTRSVRGVPVEGEELLLVGGEGHRPGEGGDTEERYAALEAFAREHWAVRSVDYRWSSQDNTTIDTVPYVGKLSPLGDQLLMATGFAKWGMTGGTAAAMILADE